MQRDKPDGSAEVRTHFVSQSHTLRTLRFILCSYPCDNFVYAFFGAIDLNATSSDAFRKQLFLCMVGQALEKKGDISVRRSKNHYGSITWQLNEIWPTGGTALVRSCLFSSSHPSPFTVALCFPMS